MFLIVFFYLFFLFRCVNLVGYYRKKLKAVINSRRGFTLLLLLLHLFLLLLLLIDSLKSINSMYERNVLPEKKCTT